MSHSLQQQLQTLERKLPRESGGGAELVAPASPAITRLRATIAELQELQSPKRQIDTYGTQKWHSEFVCLREVEKVPGLDLTGAQIRGYIWGKIIASRFGRFQMAFCHPGDWIVPRSVLLAVEQERKVKPRELDQLSLLPCIVHPDFVPVNLSMSIGLLPANYATLENLEKIQKRGSLAAITGLKLVLEAALPLSDLQRRAFVVMPASETLRKTYPKQLAKLRPEAYGTIIILRGLNAHAHRSEPQEQEATLEVGRLTAELHESPYGTYRQYQHIPRGYEKERDQENRITLSLAALGARIVRDWDPANTAQRDALKDDFREKLTQAQEFLLRRRARGLATARDVVHEALKPAVLAAADKNSLLTTIATIRDGFATRERDQAKIQRHLRSTEFRLGTFTAQADLFFNAYYDMLKTASVAFVAQQLPANKGQRTQLFEQQTVNPLSFAKALHATRPGSSASGQPPREFSEATDYYPGLALRPYRVFLEALQRHYDAALQAATEGKLPRLQKELVAMAITIKYHRTTSTFARMCDIAATPKTNTFRKLVPVVAELEVLLREKSIFPDLKTPDVDAPFRKLRDEVGRIRKACEYHAQHRDLRRVTKHLVRMKEFFQKLDIEKQFLKLNLT